MRDSGGVCDMSAYRDVAFDRQCHKGPPLALATMRGVYPERLSGELGLVIYGVMMASQGNTRR